METFPGTVSVFSQTAIAILHVGNFVNGIIWSNAIRQRGSHTIIRVAAREVEVPKV